MSQTNYQLFPKAILSVSRQELNQVPLTHSEAHTVEQSILPSDLQGHFFLVAPVGTVDSYQKDETSPFFPSIDGWTPLFNGDGMIYRVDFANSQATLTTRIVKPPCYYADKISYENPQFTDLKFRNSGFGRFSLVTGTTANIGVRNQLNTAFVPFQFSTDAQPRLLVTWDTGRPFEIDPQTLTLLSPLGRNDEWNPMLSFLGNPPFPQVLTSAHPCFDPQGGQQHEGEFFTVNVSKSVSTLLNLSSSAQPRLKKAIAKVKPSPFKSQLKVLKGFLDIFLAIDKIITWIVRLFLKKGDSIYLLRWQGKASKLREQPATFDRWDVVNEKGHPLKIRQTLHQMGITQDYIVLADTAFKFSLGEVLPFLHDDVVDHIEMLANDFLDSPQLPYTDLYIVRRADLTADKKSVKSRHIRIDFPMAHYLVDYDNPDGKIVLHAAHNCATDPAETLRSSDQSIYSDLGLTASLRKLAGSVTGPTDVSRLGCHVIDVENATVTSHLVYDIHHTWATAFYAYRPEQETSQFEDIYWNSWGCWTDILSRHIFNLYKNYDGRIVPLGDPNEPQNEAQPTLLSLTAKGVPSSIVRVHISRGDNGQPTGIELQDFYQFPEGYLGTSMQFVPKANATGSRAGYLVCVVLKSDEMNVDKNEIWIFDAEKENLGGKPICCLTHPAMNVGFTLHTTWMAPRSPQPAPSSTYDVQQDYQPRLQNWLTQELKNGTISLETANTIENLFKEVYKGWEDAHTVGH